MGQTGTLSLSSGCVNRSSMKLLTCSVCRNCAQCQVPRQDCWGFIWAQSSQQSEQMGTICSKLMQVHIKFCSGL